MQQLLSMIGLRTISEKEKGMVRTMKDYPRTTMPVKVCVVLLALLLLCIPAQAQEFRDHPMLNVQEIASMAFIQAAEELVRGGYKEVDTEEIYDLTPGSNPYTQILADGKKISGQEAIPLGAKIKVIGHFPKSTYQLDLEIEVKENLFLNKYDILVTMGNEAPERIRHGENQKLSYHVTKGRYQIMIRRADKEDLEETLSVEISSDLSVKYSLVCKNEKIELTEIERTQEPKEGYFMTPTSSNVLLHKDADLVVEELKKMGFQSVEKEETQDSIWGSSPIGSVTEVRIGEKTGFLKDEQFSQTDQVTVFCHVSTFAFLTDTYEITEKERFALPYTLESGDSIEDISFVADDPSVVQVDDAGNFTALIPGSTTVRAMCAERECAQCSITVNEIIVPIDSITLSWNERNVPVGSFFELSYEYSPADANYTDVRIQMSNKLVEQCEEQELPEQTHKFYSSEQGQTEILLYQDDRLLGSCLVNAEMIVIEDLTFQNQEETVYIGRTIPIPYTLTPGNATNKGLQAISKNEKTASAEIDERGDQAVLVKGIAAGKTSIQITTPDQKVYSQKITVKEVLPEALTLELPDTKKTVFLGDRFKLTVQWSPEDTTKQTLTWASSKSNIIRIDTKGEISAVGVGTAVITARHPSGLKQTISIEVLPIAVEEITLSCEVPEKFYNGQKLQIHAEIQPQNATDKKMIWKSDDESVATVSDKGVVTAKKPGTVNITAQSANEIAGSVTLQVTQSPRKFSITWSMSLRYNDHVGSNWSKSATVNGEPCFSGKTITVEPGGSVNIQLNVRENDKSPDVGYEYINLKLTDEMWEKGFERSGIIVVEEDMGRYSGHEAGWGYQIKVKPIG